MPTIRAYWKAKDLGRCVECFAYHDEETVRCEKCREKRRVQKQRYRGSSRGQIKQTLTPEEQAAAKAPNSSHARRLAAGF